MNHDGEVTQSSPDAAALDVVVTDNHAAHRYEAHIDGELVGLTTYSLVDDRVVFTHAEVYPKWEGKGVGGELARGALDDVVAQGKWITPKCPFIVDFVRHHPTYLDHVDERHRAELAAGVEGSTDPDGK